MPPKLVLVIPGHPSVSLDPEHGVYKLGRASDNDVALEDLSLSRHHACVRFSRGQWLAEDLGSKNGTRLNGAKLTTPAPIGTGDELSPGNLKIKVCDATETGPAVVIQARETAPWVPSLMLAAEELRRGGVPVTEGQRAQAALALLEQVAADLAREGAAESQLLGLLEALHSHLHADRGAILLRDPAGQVYPAASCGGGPEGAAIQIPRTLVDAALGQGQAILLADGGGNDGAFQASASMVNFGIRSALATPLEAEGQILGVLYVDVMNPARRFDREDLRLATVIAHLAASRVRAARMEAEATKHRALETEMGHARRIQQGFLPARPPCVEGYEVLGFNAPAWRVSGDLYGSWILEDGSLCAAVADVSGKGMGPGLLMVTFHAYMDAWTDWASLPAVLLERLSRTLARHTESNRYITAFLVHLEPDDGRLRFACAGHPPALLRRQSGAIEVLDAPGLPLAMLPGQAPYGHGETTLASGDLVLLYTDGLAEAESPGGDEFGLEGLKAVLAKDGERSLLEIRHALVLALQEHLAGQSPKDDQTFFLLRRK
ncbi:MAG: SpoIIE family protein phosphatase [Holophagaceae bacterium]|nr:SpoIIE family protein phosphatase [Holophagaceae bacterium]